MSSPDAGPELLAPVLAAVRALGRHPAGDRAVILIDGPSGAGKSTLADAVVAAWPGPVAPTLVRLDDIYPGWEGLDAAIDQIGSRVLLPRRAGGPAAWQRHDWATGSPAEWHTVAADRPLIVEGCGALAHAHAALSDVRVWLDADDGIRKQRALDRDGGVFEAHWDQWQQDWESYRERERPEQWATVRLTATPGRAATGQPTSGQPTSGQSTAGQSAAGPKPEAAQ
ncbi:ATP-binding protein [Cryobacterium sp. SO2]|uniref:ATP-binding protein n=1 Tax=Cryobacterium sp. SO2 TaxID=1897060 RepID=UPI00223D2714|nr:ATP-binding protein [Cryobacterium sp. SO2]WEO75861.1 ATP-binding protein [Cryobacterium sp. SO2]